MKNFLIVARVLLSLVIIILMCNPAQNAWITDTSILCGMFMLAGVDLISLGYHFGAKPKTTSGEFLSSLLGLTAIVAGLIHLW